MNKVFVSGGSGYIALHCIARLISKGFNVKTSLRSMDRQSEIVQSVSKVVDCSDKIEFCELDLTKDKGWDDAIKGCEYVLHIASPLMLGFPKDPDDIILPAVNGLKRCIKSAVKNRVKRFVMTSSFAAIGSGSKSKINFNDNDWTDLSNEKIMPYEISKTKAEKKMWEMAKKANLDACAINPVLVLGPSMTGVLSMSNRVTIKKIFSLPFIPDLSISVVGVQDVAEAHVMAMENDDATGNRFLLSEKTIKLKELCNILFKAGYKKVPRFLIPNFLLKLVALFIPSLRLIASRLGSVEKLYTKNANNILGWYPTSVDSEIVNSAKQLYDVGILKK